MREDQETAELRETADELASVSGAGFDKLTVMQRAFAVQYVLQGGNATAAAEAAGYASPDVAGTRVRLNPKVAELINLLALADARAVLPVAVATLLEIAQDKLAPFSERRKAALDLARIGGALGSGAPTVAVQVNNGAGAGDGAPADSVSVVIRNVWSARSARLSGIPAPMPDSSEPLTIAHRGADLDDG